MTRGDGFPADFTWGAATASYQIEGSTAADGRGISTWDVFSRKPGAVLGGMTGDLACDSYRRWKDDVALVSGLGIDSYRFSIAWPRIQPTGSGSPNAAGLDHYRRLAEALLEAGVEPAVTLYHWDLPQALEDQGGWPARDTALRFADYADIVARGLGDVVGKWFTINEPWCQAFLGYDLGVHAPGIRSEAAAYRAVHHLLLGHGLAARAIRASGSKAPVGIVLNVSTPRPATRRRADLLAADLASDQQTALWLDPLYGRGYPGRHLASHPDAAMPVEEGDLAIIASPCEHLGINYYFENVVEADPGAPGASREVPSWREKTEMGWDIVPEGLHRQLSLVSKRWPVPALYVTENGCAFAGDPGADGRVRDVERIAYMKAHIAACRRAITDGIPLRGYYAWSLLDNFEWAWGYSKRFGLVHVDFVTQERRPKDSYRWYRDVVAGHEGH